MAGSSCAYDLVKKGADFEPMERFKPVVLVPSSWLAKAVSTWPQRSGPSLVKKVAAVSGYVFR